MKSSPKVVVCVPAFNEEKSIAKMIVSARKYADAIIVCDDGSNDMTGEIAEALGVQVIRHERNMGKGEALKDLVEQARKLDPVALVTIDADDTLQRVSFGFPGDLSKRELVEFRRGRHKVRRPTAEELRAQYISGCSTVKELARVYHVSRKTVFEWLKGYHIQTRTAARHSWVHFPDGARTPNDLIGAGLYDGDGDKAHPYRVSFVNADVSLLSTVISWFESLGLERHELKFRIYVSDTSSHQALVDELRVKLGISSSQFWKPVGVRGVRNYAGMTYVNRKFTEEFHKFRCRVRNGINGPSSAAEYLTGVFAADGSAHVDRRNRCFVGIAFNAKSERYLERVYMRCLELLGVGFTEQIKDSKGELRVFYHDSILKLYGSGVFNLHPAAKAAVERYLDGFHEPQVRKNSATQVTLEACHILEKVHLPITSQNLAMELHRTRDWAAHLLLRLARSRKIVPKRYRRYGGIEYEFAN